MTQCDFNTFKFVFNCLMSNRGKLTTLDVKNSIRVLGYFITQANVSDWCREFAKQNIETITSTVEDGDNWLTYYTKPTLTLVYTRRNGDEIHQLIGPLTSPTEVWAVNRSSETNEPSDWCDELLFDRTKYSRDEVRQAFRHYYSVPFCDTRAVTKTITPTVGGAL